MGLCRVGVALALSVACAGAVALPNSCLAADGRGYELVSPPDKSGNSVDIRASVQSSPDGNAVAFAAPGAFGDAATGVIGDYYLSQRSAGGWSTRGVDAPQSNPAGQVATPTLYLSDDLSRAFQFSSQALAPGAIAGGGNFYLLNTQNGTRQLAVATTASQLKRELALYGFRSPTGASSDLSHVVFQTTAPLLPAASPGASNVYEYANGQLRLVNILDDGTTVDANAGVGSTARSSRLMSADGSRIFFNSSSGALYARLGGTTTIPLSVSRRAGDPSTPVPAAFGGASRDGNIVYFRSNTPLTDDASDPGAYADDVYRYDFTTDRLTDVTASRPAQPADIFRINAVSENGDYVFFSGWGQLTPGSIQYSQNFYVSHNGDIRLIGVLAEGEPFGPYELSTSPNGRYVAFTSSQRLTAADATDPACRRDAYYSNSDGNCLEVYVFDAVTGALDCPSCETVDGRNRFADLGPRTPGISSYMPTLISDDGHLFFNSEARLVNADTNGARDVYEWAGQQSTLVSPGRGAGESTLADVSPDFRNVYFFSPQRLVAQDTDNEIDVYDARVGGGLSSQNEIPGDAGACSGDGCQGVLAPPRGLAEIPTVSFDGRGNGSAEEPKAPSRVSRAVVSGPKTIRGSSFVLKVKVAAAGRVSASGGRIATVTKTVTNAGTYRLRVRLTAGARRVLRRSKRIKVPVRVTYVPKSGVRSSTTLNVTFKA